MFKLDSFVGSSAKPIPYERMFEEINSDYLHKYDVLRNLAFEVLHFAMKMRQPMEIEKYQ
jgi:hypothetical protein